VQLKRNALGAVRDGNVVIVTGTDLFVVSKQSKTSTVAVRHVRDVPRIAGELNDLDGESRGAAQPAGM
jgi:hypothetical protein